MNSRNLMVIDLFAGVGGISLGAVRAGFHLALAVELDRHAMAAHQLNFPNTNHWSVDISLIDGKQLLERAGLKKGELDGLAGGPPCQGFSTMGKRSVSDPRNNLFVKFFELIKDCQPKFFVVENVRGILHNQYDVIRTEALKYVENDYVVLDPMRMKASDFGAPTNRERVFFIGYRSDAVQPLLLKDFEAVKVSTPTTVADALRGLPTRINEQWLTEPESWRPVRPLPESPYWDRVSGQIPEGVGDNDALEKLTKKRLTSGCFGTRHSLEVVKRYSQLKPGEADKISKSIRLKPDGLCPTLRAGTGSDRGSYQAVRPIHPTLPRVITPREAARLQGFPDWYRFAPSKWHSFRQIGNSVSPLLAESIMAVIRNALVNQQLEGQV